MIATFEEGATQRRLVHLVIFAGILALSLLLAAANFWLGSGFFFFGLLLLVILRFRSSAHRNWVVLGYVLLAFWAIAIRVWLSFLTDSQIAQVNIARMLLNNRAPRTDWGAVLAMAGASLLYALGALLLVVVLIAAIVAAGTYRAEGVSYWAQFWHTLLSILGFRRFLVEIDEGEVKGKERDRYRLETLGGPGRLIIYPGQLVVLRKHGLVTRVMGVGKVDVRYQEKIKAIVPILGKAGVQEIEHVLTRDGIPLMIKLAHSARLENVGETDSRLHEMNVQRDQDVRALQILKAGVTQVAGVRTLASAEQLLASLKAVDDPDSLTEERIEALDRYVKAEVKLQQDERAIEKLERVVSGETIGEGLDGHYIGLANIAPPDLFEATKVQVESNLRDALMAHDFDDLFKIEEQGGAVQSLIDSRKIGEIETFVKEKVRSIKQKDGLIMNFVDVVSIEFPDMVQEKLNEELAMYVDSRAKVSAAELDEQASRYEARAKVIRARAKAQQMMLEGRGEGEARAAFFRELIHELKREDLLQEEQLVKAVLELMGRMVSAKDWEAFARASIPSDYWIPSTSSRNSNGIRDHTAD